MSLSFGASTVAPKLEIGKGKDRAPRNVLCIGLIFMKKCNGKRAAAFALNRTDAIYKSTPENMFNVKTAALHSKEYYR
jgi:hypothetical protein